MKCAICGSEIRKGVMDKIRGTYIKSGKKRYAVCPACQKEGEEALKERLGKKL